MILSSPISGDNSLLDPVSLRILAHMECVAWRREMAADGSVSYPWFSDNVALILGFPTEELTVNRKGALNLIHWADRDPHLAALRRSAETLEPCQEDFRAITAAGETRWLRGISYPRREDDGRVVWNGLWQDHTRHFRAEAQHQMLMDHAADCIFITSGSTHITWSNAAARRNFGFQPDELISRDFDELIDLSHDGETGEAGEELAGGLPRGSREVTARRLDGSTFPFEMTISEVRSDGKLSLIVIGRDISQRRHTEQMLAASEQRLRVTFAAASLGIVVVARDGTIQFYNPAFETMAGKDSDSLRGQNLDSVVPPGILPPPSRIPPPGMSFSVVCQPRRSDHDAPEDARHWRLTGTQFAAAPDARDLSILLLIEDITEVTRIAQERRQLELMLQEGHKLEALGRLAGGIAHELNNMLGPILMGAEMVARTAPLDDKNGERVQRIIDAAKNSRDIVRNVLAYCRKEQKTLTPVDLVPVFDGFSAMAASVLPPTIKVEKHCHVPHAAVIADAGQLQQVLLNMANNARDAMYGIGTLTLELTILRPADLLAFSRQVGEEGNGGESGPNPLATLDLDRPHADIKVSDTGCGMSRATAAKIFDPFFTTKPVGQGTGLGLSVVQGIITSMGGIITVTSTLRVGTTFHVILPLSEPPPL